MTGIVNTRIHLDQQFAIETFGQELQELKIDMILDKNPMEETNSFRLTRMNTVFLYYIATALI